MVPLLLLQGLFLWAHLGLKLRKCFFLQLWHSLLDYFYNIVTIKIMVSSSQAYEISFKALVIKSRTIQLFCLLNFKPSRFALSTFVPSPPVQESKDPVFKWDGAPSSPMPTAFTPTGAKLQVSKPVMLTSHCQILMLLSEKHLLLIIYQNAKLQSHLFLIVQLI